MNYREHVVEVATSFLNRYVSEKSHEFIVEIYNSVKPHPRGYKLKSNDPWCAAFITAVGYECGYKDYIFPECGCFEMMKKYKQADAWKIDNPLPGDIVMLDWDKNGVANHTGIVVSRSDNYITVIEGNANNAVRQVSYRINNPCIMGYCAPKYPAEKTDDDIAFEWAVNNGLMTGMKRGDSVTYEKLALVINRYNKLIGKEK